MKTILHWEILMNVAATGLNAQMVNLPWIHQMKTIVEAKTFTGNDCYHMSRRRYH